MGDCFDLELEVVDLSPVVELEVDDKVVVDLGNKILKPLTITQNGTYEGGIEDGKQVGFNPVVVNVPVPSDTTATAEDIRLGKTAYVGGEKVTGTAERSLKKLLDITKTCANMFYLSTYTDDDIHNLIDYDDTENVVNMSGMFNQLSVTYQLRTTPAMNTSKVTNMNSIFRNQRSLKSVYPYDTKKCKNLYRAFANTAITEIPLFDTRNATNVGDMFAACGSLKKVPALDVRNCKGFGVFVTLASSLEEIWIINIQDSLQVGSGTSWGHLIKKECLIHLIKECRDTGSAKTLTVGSANLAKITGDNAVYVKVIPITDEMRAEDDLVDEKLPFVVCEPTDEGAMLITEYALLKNWQIAG